MKYMKNLLWLFLMSGLFTYCHDGEKGADRNVVIGRRLEISFSKTNKVKHGESFTIDSFVFVHSKYKGAQYIDGASKPADTTFEQPKSFILSCAENVKYVTPEKDIRFNTSTNQIAQELAIQLSHIQNKKGDKIYQVDSSPALFYEGKVIFSRLDKNTIRLKRSSSSLEVRVRK